MGGRALVSGTAVVLVILVAEKLAPDPAADDRAGGTGEDRLTEAHPSAAQ